MIRNYAGVKTPIYSEENKRQKGFLAWKHFFTNRRRKLLWMTKNTSKKLLFNEKKMFESSRNLESHYISNEMVCLAAKKYQIRRNDLKPSNILLTSQIEG